MLPQISSILPRLCLPISPPEWKEVGEIHLNKKGQTRCRICPYVPIFNEALALDQSLSARKALNVDESLLPNAG